MDEIAFLVKILGPFDQKTLVRQRIKEKMESESRC